MYATNCGRVCLNEKIFFKAEHIDYKTGFQTRPAIYRKFYPNKDVNKKTGKHSTKLPSFNESFLFSDSSSKGTLFPVFLFYSYIL